MIKRVLVPIDGSDHADRALGLALDLADKYEASIEIINVIQETLTYSVIEEPLVSSAWTGSYSKELKASHEKMLSEVLKKAKKKKPDLEISTKLILGRPSDEIVKRAKEGGFDMIVMGSRGLGGIKEFLLGSVSDRVADHAECPVLIVK